MRLKTKLILGLGSLFLMILLYGILSIVSITRLKSDARFIIRSNHETLVYSNNMLKALNEGPTPEALQAFALNLRQQEANITEPGEQEATEQVKQGFETWKAHPGDSSARIIILKGLQRINALNQQAIFRKNQLAAKTADTATAWLTVILSVIVLVAFTLVVNIPSVVGNPIRALSEGITAIAGRNYKMRIYLEQKDEFGELAHAFNSMAERLDEWENSSLAQVKFEKSRIEAIISQMRDAIIGLSEKGNILFMNGVAAHLTGLKEKNVLGKYAPDIALKNDLLRTLLQDGRSRELKIYADEKESYFSMEHIQVRNGDQLIGEVIVLRNITPFHELNEAKTNFIATVSHELKTPLSSIKMSTRLLNDARIGTLNREQQDLAQSINEDAERLLRITGELLNMTQVETGNIQLRFQPVSPAHIVQEALQAVQVQAQQAGITLNVDLEEPLPFINADAEKTSWVLINLLTNAIKYSYEQSVVRIRVFARDRQVVFSVTDTGRGIEEKYLPRLFERYYKVPGSSDKAGTGLGLSISKEFIEAQNGELFVHSEIGQGSEFGFVLQVAGA